MAFAFHGDHRRDRRRAQWRSALCWRIASRPARNAHVLSRHVSAASVKRNDGEIVIQPPEIIGVERRIPRGGALFAWYQRTAAGEADPIRLKRKSSRGDASRRRYRRRRAARARRHRMHVFRYVGKLCGARSSIGTK